MMDKYVIINNTEYDTKMTDLYTAMQKYVSSLNSTNFDLTSATQKLNNPTGKLSITAVTSNLSLQPIIKFSHDIVDNIITITASTEELTSTTNVNTEIGEKGFIALSEAANMTIKATASMSTGTYSVTLTPSYTLIFNTDGSLNQCLNGTAEITVNSLPSMAFVNFQQLSV